MITQELVKELFRYEDGELFWKVSGYRNQIEIGSKAGTLQSTGYQTIGINYKIYLKHRLIFMYHHGYFPTQVDHIDNDKLNNRIENLREATQSQNMQNRSVNKSFRSSKYKGVVVRKRSKCLGVQIWAQIKVNSKRIYLGSFLTEEEAALAYNEAAIKYFGDRAKLNEVSL